MASKPTALDRNPLWCVGLIVVIGCSVYASSLGGVFVFDDLHHITDNDKIKDLGDPGTILGTRRPLVYLSLAVNYAIGGENPFGYHIFNIFVHLLAAIVLFDLLRRLLSRFPMYEALSGRLALIATLLWMVHPLQTESVTYIIQRGESMMGLFYLVMLYALLRGADKKQGTAWYAVAIASCACGLASKGVMVSAPLVAILFDRVFLARSFSEVFTKRLWVHGGIFAMTFGVLALSGVMGGTFREPGPRTTAGFGLMTHTPTQYLQSQPGALLTYLRLTFWPAGLCLDYSAEPASSYSDWLPQGLIILALLGTTVWAFRKSPALGFIGAFFFLVLGPTSSFVPINDIVFEHRMYLPLASVTILVVLGAHTALKKFGPRHISPMSPGWWLALALAVVSIGGLGAATIDRNSYYHDEKVMWRDVLAKRPDNSRAMVNLGFILASKDENYPEAYPLLIRSVELKPRFSKARRHLAQVLIELGRSQDALVHLRAAESMSPGDMEIHYLKGCALSLTGEKKRAIAAFDKCFEIHAAKPRGVNEKRIPKVYLNRGRTYGLMKKPKRAEQDFRRSLELEEELFLTKGIEPDYFDVKLDLVRSLHDQQKFDDEYERLCKELIAENALAWPPRHRLLPKLLKDQDYQAAKKQCQALLQMPLPPHVRDEVVDALRFAEQRIAEQRKRP